MVTDYSSIFLDYLYLDKPVFFFPYDYSDYINNERDLYFEYDELLPGPQCFNQFELEKKILYLLDNDEYKEERLNVFNKVFEKRDFNMSERIDNEIIELMES